MRRHTACSAVFMVPITKPTLFRALTEVSIPARGTQVPQWQPEPAAFLRRG
jgi:hypothetical protein